MILPAVLAFCVRPHPAPSATPLLQKSQTNSRMTVPPAGDHYRVLQLSRAATQEDVKQVWLSVFHPSTTAPRIVRALRHGTVPALVFTLDVTPLQSRLSVSLSPLSSLCASTRTPPASILVHRSFNCLQAYRRLARTCHPDKGGSAAAFAALQAAFETLSDPKARAAYDALAADIRFRPGVAQQNPYGGSGAPHQVSNLEVGQQKTLQRAVGANAPSMWRSLASSGRQNWLLIHHHP